MFIEVTTVRDGKKRLINSGHITMILESKIAGCEIIIDKDEGRPLAVVEDYAEIKRLLQPDTGGERMTREEAVNWLRYDIDMMKFDPVTGEDAYLNDEARKVIEAEEMAIKALAQPECEDAISRAAILAMIEVIADCAANGHGFDYPKWKKYVESLSSVTPKPKTGRWISEVEDWRNQITWVKCSECGFDSSVSYSYCPSCGAKMEESE